MCSRLPLCLFKALAEPGERSSKGGRVRGAWRGEGGGVLASLEWWFVGLFEVVNSEKCGGRCRNENLEGL